ncbi:hypothetical protein [Streptomyces sp. NPDC059816]|uniref:hypothetical protein n=1 Tax=Streptomyces sp. NPDC059816 TaxID=3346960 RepID=UPI00364C81D1
MQDIGRREMIGAGAGALAALGLAGCDPGGNGGSGNGGTDARPGKEPGPVRSSPTGRPAKPIGDGSTSYTGKQPHQPPAPVPLEPGQTPPQFVVFSWDGAGEVGNGLFPRFLDLAREHDAHMTFFLSGIYLLPESKKRLYRPPNNPVGASDIGYLKDENIRATLTCVDRAWREGHEIGTHFNGHFCGGSGSVAHWTSAQWRSEIEQAESFVGKWRTHTGWTDLPPLPFDYQKELVGARTPCLLGRDRLLPAARERGWRYDSSSPGGTQRWPGKRGGLWDLPLQAIPFPGRSFEVLSMDYNIMVNQSGNSTQGPTRHRARWREQATDALLAGFRRAYESNRAPLFIGNHFEQWNGGIYMDAVENALRRIADTAGGPGKSGRSSKSGRSGASGKTHDNDIRIVSFRQLVDWLDVQRPEVLDRLRALDVGRAPVGGWRAYLGKSAATPTT